MMVAVKERINLNKAVKQRIIYLCKENRISVNKLCLLSGITQSTLNNIMIEKSMNPTIGTIKKICDGLDISIAEFFNAKDFYNLDQELH